MPDWLHIDRADTPLILAMPHGGRTIPAALLPRFVSHWTATRDANWHIGDLYDGLAEATIVSTSMSRSVIDVNRDPSGSSLYPGLATTELCPTTTFDGDPLYRPGMAPDDAEIADRRDRWFSPYHEALSEEIARLRAQHPRVVVYDCHSIRSRIPRLFDGELPAFNIGTNGGATCDPALAAAVATVCAASGRSHVLDGRFRGGWTTRHYGRPEGGVHAIQMEIAIRAYLREPSTDVDPENWPTAYDPQFAAPLRKHLAQILRAALDFTKGPA
ncbi:N-formylglutamate deformylase [Sphingomonas sp. GB1N7]|uniref:N-formylglutamate deformylase n=1 Tax=Parasphingomonas caseinilytica TaxID=3096158 RepID=UPI002FC9AE4A